VSPQGEPAGRGYDTFGPPLSDLAPRFAPQRDWTPDGGCFRVRAKEPVKEATVEIFRPTGTVPHLSDNDTSALTWDFAFELNSGPSPCTGSGPRIGRRKTRLTWEPPYGIEP